MNEATVAEQWQQLEQLAPYIIGLLVIPALGVLKNFPWVQKLDYNHITLVASIAVLVVVSLAMGLNLDLMRIIELALTTVGVAASGYGVKKTVQKVQGNRPSRRIFTNEGG